MAQSVLEADINRDNYNQYIDNQTASSIGSFVTALGVAAIQSQ